MSARGLITEVHSCLHTQIHKPQRRFHGLYIRASDVTGKGSILFHIIGSALAASGAPPVSCSIIPLPFNLHSLRNIVCLQSTWRHLKSWCPNSLRKPSMAFLPVHTMLFFCCYKFAWNACNLESQVFVSPDRAWCSPTILQLLRCLCCRRVRVQFCILFAISSHSPCFPAGPTSLWLNLEGWGGTLWNLTELARGVQYDVSPSWIPLPPCGDRMRTLLLKLRIKKSQWKSVSSFLEGGFHH